MRNSALVWGFPSQAVFRWSGSFLLVPCFCCPVSRFDRGAVSPSRPRVQLAPRASGVKAGRRPPPEAARSGLDGGEHGATLSGSGGAIGSIAAGRIRGELACRAEPSVPQQPCIRYDLSVGDHDAVMRIDGEAPKGGPNLQQRHEGHGRKRDTTTSDRHRQRPARKRTRAE